MDKQAKVLPVLGIIFIVLIVIGISSLGFLYWSKNYTKSSGNAKKIQVDSFEQLLDECEEDWECGRWNKCKIYGNEIYQERDCNDKNDCGSEENRPLEKNPCSRSEHCDELNGEEICDRDDEYCYDGENPLYVYSGTDYMCCNRGCIDEDEGGETPEPISNNCDDLGREICSIIEDCDDSYLDADDSDYCCSGNCNSLFTGSFGGCAENDLDCFIDAAETCEKTILTYSLTLDILGWVQDTTNEYTILGDVGGDCILYFELTDVSGEYSEEARQNFKSQEGMTDEEIDEQEDSMNQALQTVIGTEQACRFTTSKLVSNFEDFQEGSYSTYEWAPYCEEL
ncbi:hypothetical protein ACFL0X_00075 [Nanoarchaeota archaeon]